MHDSECLLEAGADELAAVLASNETARRMRNGARVLLLFRKRDEAAATILRGIAHHQQLHRDWNIQFDECPRTTAETRWQMAQGWAGVISRDTTPALVEACAELQVPLVDLDDSPPYSGVSKMRYDHAAFGALGAECFLDRGFTHSAFVGSEEHAWARERRSGFVGVMRRAGQEPDFFAFEMEERDLGSRERDGRRLADWLAQLPKPTAVMACDDRTAAQVLQAARGARLHVPEEIAVLGADNDVALCELTAPSLSSVVPGAFQLGCLAADHLHRRICDSATPPCDLRVDPAGIAHRRTTDALAIPDRAVAAAVRYIAEHACEGLTVDAVLPHAAASRSQLEKKFRRYLGRSPQAEIRRVQLERIRQLLADTDLPLKRIAELSGFEYMEYMCVVFRRLTGETPGAYRRRRRPLIRSRNHESVTIEPASAVLDLAITPPLHASAKRPA
ncbi:MAG TPA: DNA-binding transcriptional regulator [Opitutaceae bacterium]|nr:DNA-binding transcriptional regulator [Opitutaceae bacterium]